MDLDRPAVDSDHAFERLLDFLKSQRGSDFTGYKRTGLMRRVRKRMHQLRIDDLDRYREQLEQDPKEFVNLFNTILINVTGFFRDPEAWQVLATQVLPRIVEPASKPIRVWSAGCSSGEEAYTMVILLAERLGWEEFRQRVTIYGTDLDTASLQQARTARFGPKSVENVPPRLLEKYFDPVDGKFVFRPELRRQVVFGRNDLSRDAPIARLDLLACRNTLMYFNAETQNRMLSRFHFALDDHGYLFLGRAEMLLTRSHLFAPHDLKSRIFVKLPRGLADVQERLQAGREELRATHVELEVTAEELRSSAEVLEAAHAELATLRAGLESRSEVLARVSDELWQRSGQLTRVRTYLDTLLANLRMAVVVLDGDRCVQLWSDHAAELWGVGAEEALDRPFSALGIGLPTAALDGPVGACLRGETAVREVTLEATDRGGEPFRCRIRCATMPDLRRGGRGVLLLMEGPAPEESDG